MASKTELERLAQMAGALRPDWPVRSVLTYLVAEHTHRAYRDLAIALAYVATDPTTVTPKRLSAAGPWWATSKDAPDPIHYARCEQVGHTSFPAHNCSACRSEALERTTQEAALIRQSVPIERVRQIRAEAAGGAS